MWPIERRKVEFIEERTQARHKGEWHEALDTNGDYFYLPNSQAEITKSSWLTRLRFVCRKCGGTRTYRVYPDKESEFLDIYSVIEPCPYCLKDEDGNPTGIDPDAPVPPWEVEG